MVQTPIPFHKTQLAKFNKATLSAALLAQVGDSGQSGPSDHCGGRERPERGSGTDWPSLIHAPFLR
jgi:hypothetical protein